jgi:hypothetical protein
VLVVISASIGQSDLMKLKRDPLIAEAIRRAVEVEDLERWGAEKPTPIPRFAALPSSAYHAPIGRRIISIFTP